MRPKYINITVSNFNFIPERVKDDERVVEREECYTAQSSQFFGGLPLPYPTLPCPTLPGQMREVSLKDEISREDEMIPQLNQIPVWITNRCEQSYMSGTNFRLASNIASHSRASAHN